MNRSGGRGGRGQEHRRRDFRRLLAVVACCSADASESSRTLLSLLLSRPTDTAAALRAIGRGCFDLRCVYAPLHAKGFV